MRGCLQRATKDKAGLAKDEHTFNLILSLGRGPDGKYKQSWKRFHGKRREAEKKLIELVSQFDRGERLEPNKITVGAYLDEWMAARIKPQAAATYKLYKSVITNHLKPAFGHIQLQQLTKLHVQRYFAELKPILHETKNSKFSDATKVCHVRVLSAALNAAVESDLLQKNVARKFINKPKLQNTSGDVLKNVWTANEARQFLTTVKEEGSAQWSALFSLLLDSGARKAEVLGLKWSDLNH
jgi:integrase